MLVIFGSRHCIKSVIESLEFFNDKTICKYKPLIIVPYLIHSFDKEVRIVSLDDIDDSWLHIKANKLPYIESYELINMCSLLDCWIGVSQFINFTKRYNKRMYSLSAIWLRITSVLFSTNLNISYLLNCSSFPANVLTR